MRALFRTPAQHAHFERFARLKVPFLSADEVREIDETHSGAACWRLFEERAEAVPMKAGEAICAMDDVVHAREGHRRHVKSEKVLGHVATPNLDGLERQVFHALGVEPPASPIKPPGVTSRSGIRHWLERLLRRGE